MIVECYTISATNTDVLAAPSRLAAIPYSGTLIMEFQAEMSSDTNHFDLTVQLPNGDVPLDGVRLPLGATAGAINGNDKYSLSFPARQGGHVLVDLTETGTAIVNCRFTLMP